MNTPTLLEKELELRHNAPVITPHTGNTSLNHIATPVGKTWARGMMSWRAGFRRFWKIFQMFEEDGGFLWAAAMAFSTLFALLPLTVLALSLMKAFDTLAGYQEIILEHLFSNLMISTNQPIVREYLNSFFEKGYEVELFGIISFIAASVLWLDSIEAGLNRVWKVKNSQTLWQRLPVYWTTLTLVPVLIGISFYLSNRVRVFMEGHGAFLATLYDLMLPIAVSWVLFFLLYRTLPAHRVSVRPALLGSLLAAFLWEAAKRLFTYYISTIANYERIYGMLGVVFSFMLWTYVTWIILLFAAEVIFSLEQRDEPTEA